MKKIYVATLLAAMSATPALADKQPVNILGASCDADVAVQKMILERLDRVEALLLQMESNLEGQGDMMDLPAHQPVKPVPRPWPVKK